ncbi:MAG: hypothetical protein ACOX1O_04420 [Eggerthellaceae bacterium]|jgi:hypothetical protein
MEFSKACRIVSIPVAFLASILLLVALPSVSYAASSSTASADQTLTKGDSAGTLFTSDSNVSNEAVTGDLYWANTQLSGDNLTVGNDLMAGSGQISLSNTEIDGDARLVCRTLTLDKVDIGGNGTFASSTLTISKDSEAKGIYCWANDLSYEGTSHYLLAYGNKIYFNGTVDGDVTLSGQEITIGPDAKVTGTLNVRSGQDLEIPETAQIANVNNTVDNPNAIDQVSQIRAKIAPYFQLGSILFVIIASILMGLIVLWLNPRHLNEARRVFCAHPFGQVLLGVLGTAGVLIATVVCFALIFTIPAGLVLLFLLLAAVLLCVPFTGASIALSFKRFPRSVRVLIGSGAGGALLFVPYVRVAVALASLVYFFGYVLRCLFMGHDDRFNYEITHRRETKHDSDGKEGKELDSPDKDSAEKAHKKDGQNSSAKEADDASGSSAGPEPSASAQSGRPRVVMFDEEEHSPDTVAKEEVQAALEGTLPTTIDSASESAEPAQDDSTAREPSAPADEAADDSASRSGATGNSGADPAAGEGSPESR